MPPSDEQLVSRIASDDREAFALLYDRHAPRLFGLLQRMLGAGAEAEDVLQEVFWQVWNRAATYDPQRSSVVVWLVVIARSRARDQLRRRPAPLELNPDTQAGMAAASENRSEHAEDVQCARRALAQLPEAERSVIGLAVFGGLTHEQIAAAESVPLGTVKTRIRRGMLRLREIMQRRESTVGM